MRKLLRRQRATSHGCSSHAKTVHGFSGPHLFAFSGADDERRLEGRYRSITDNETFWVRGEKTHENLTVGSQFLAFGRHYGRVDQVGSLTLLGFLSGGLEQEGIRSGWSMICKIAYA